MAGVHLVANWAPSLRNETLRDGQPLLRSS
jgi:hypothetical protein